jgi:DNA topoisomerase-1
VHPSVINAYLDGNVVREARRSADRALRESLDELRPQEAAVLALLRRRLRDEEKATGAGRGRGRRS